MARDLRFQTGHAGTHDALREVFRAAFTASESVAEGDAIASLFDDLLITTASQDLEVVSAWRGDVALSCLTFTRLHYSDDPRHVRLMAPVAVAPMAQRTGVGQSLIAHGLEVMRAKGADLAVTYGDPNYYRKSGFVPVSIHTVPPPHPLSMPHGWQAVALNGAKITPLKGAPTCAPAWGKPEFW